MSEPGKPLPHPTPETVEFWKATKERRLLLKKCSDCGHFFFYPRILCPDCLSTNVEWVPSKGTGTVHTFTIVHRAPSKGFEKDCPFAFALIELEEGPRMISNVVGCKPETVLIGMKVKVIFEDVNEEITLPKFEPA